MQHLLVNISLSLCLKDCFYIYIFIFILALERTIDPYLKKKKSRRGKLMMKEPFHQKSLISFSIYVTRVWVTAAQISLYVLYLSSRLVFFQELLSILCKSFRCFTSQLFAQKCLPVSLTEVSVAKQVWVLKVSEVRSERQTLSLQQLCLLSLIPVG